MSATAAAPDRVAELEDENTRLRARIDHLEAVALANLVRREEVLGLLRRYLDLADAKTEITRRRTRTSRT